MVKGQKNDRSYNPHLCTKTKIFFSSKINIPVQNAERSASAGISYSQLQIQIMLQIMSSIMRTFPIISWSKVKKTTEVFIILICRQKISFLSAISKHVFEMLRGVQVQLFFFTNKNSNYAFLSILNMC